MSFSYRLGMFSINESNTSPHSSYDFVHNYVAHVHFVSRTNEGDIFYFMLLVFHFNAMGISCHFSRFTIIPYFFWCLERQSIFSITWEDFEKNVVLFNSFKNTNQQKIYFTILSRADFWCHQSSYTLCLSVICTTICQIICAPTPNS